MWSMKVMKKTVRETKTTGRERSSGCLLSLLQISTKAARTRTENLLQQ
jgi:hypothetical protein